MYTSRVLRRRSVRRFSLEELESRVNLSCEVSPGIPATDAARGVEALNCFSGDLYQHYQREQGNLFYSPLSVGTALAMAYAGAAGDTATEMEQTLNFGSAPGIHDAFRSLLGSLENPNGAFTLSVANALWPDEDLAVLDEFRQQLQTNYGAHAQTLDYDNPSLAANIINSWVQQETNGKIEELVTANDLEDSVLVLTNSIYFRSLWADPFDPRATQMAPFVLDSGTTIQVPTMYHQSDFRYTRLDGFQVLELPYRDERTSMVLMLPAAGSANQQLGPEMLGQVDDWLDSAPAKTGCIDVYLPKFNITVGSELNVVLAGMGMSTAFTPAADFSRIAGGTGIWIDQVIHEATIEVNEQGTEAAAATAVDFRLCFAEGTPVLTPDGAKPIEEIQVGDLVLSRDENDVHGPVEPKRVERTFKRYGETIGIRISGQLIRTTPEHPFYVADRGWTAARDLRPGQLLASENGRWHEVETVIADGKGETVYNFRVADHHTYFVGRESWGFAVWVHNCYEVAFQANRPFHFLIRDNTTDSILFMGRISDPLQESGSLTPRVSVNPPTSDLNGDGAVDAADMGIIFGNWSQSGVGDLNSDGIVDAADAGILISDWTGDSAMAPSPALSLSMPPQAQNAEVSRSNKRDIDRVMESESFWSIPLVPAFPGTE